MRRRAAAALLVAAAVGYLGVEQLVARAMPGYSWRTDTVSALGAADSPRAALMNAGFVGSAALLAVAVAMARTVLPGGRARAVLVGTVAVHVVGMVLVAAFPVGVAATAGWHVAGAVSAIVGGDAAVVAAGLVARRAGTPRAAVVSLVALGVVGLLAFAVFGAGGGALAERVAVYPIQAAELLGAALLLRAARR